MVFLTRFLEWSIAFISISVKHMTCIYACIYIQYILDSFPPNCKYFILTLYIERVKRHLPCKFEFSYYKGKGGCEILYTEGYRSAALLHDC